MKAFSFTISDSVKALMQIVRLKPDLILLDVRMSGINGMLCRLPRNHITLKATPIIMVGNGIIDRVKARLVGFWLLDKPFTQSDLLKLCLDIYFNSLY